MTMRILGATLASVALLAMAWGSTAPLGTGTADDAIIRVSLAARPQRIESCRTLSDEELAQVAPQMRQRVVCEGTTARYRLTLERNGTTLVSRLLRGGGLRHDRRMYVLQDVRVPAGESALRVRIERLDTVPVADSVPSQSAVDPRDRRSARDAVMPPRLDLDEDVRLVAREVVLISYDPESRELVTKSRASDVQRSSGATSRGRRQNR